MLPAQRQSPANLPSLESHGRVRKQSRRAESTLPPKTIPRALSVAFPLLWWAAWPVRSRDSGKDWSYARIYRAPPQLVAQSTQEQQRGEQQPAAQRDPGDLPPVA